MSVSVSCCLKLGPFLVPVAATAADQTPDLLHRYRRKHEGALLEAGVDAGFGSPRIPESERHSRGFLIDLPGESLRLRVQPSLHNRRRLLLLGRRLF